MYSFVALCFIDIRFSLKATTDYQLAYQDLMISTPAPPGAICVYPGKTRAPESRRDGMYSLVALCFIDIRFSLKATTDYQLAYQDLMISTPAPPGAICVSR